MAECVYGWPVIKAKVAMDISISMGAAATWSSPILNNVVSAFSQSDG